MANGRGQEREKVFEHIVWGFTINLRALVAEWVMFDLVVSMGKRRCVWGVRPGNHQSTRRAPDIYTATMSAPVVYTSPTRLPYIRHGMWRLSMGRAKEQRLVRGVAPNLWGPT